MKRQKGMSLIGLIIVLAVMGVVAALGAKIGPIYMESYKVDAAMNNVIEEGGRNIYEMKKALMRRFDIDDIESVTAKEINVSQRGSKKMIRIKYTVQRNVINNLDVIVSFDKKVQSN